MSFWCKQWGRDSFHGVSDMSQRRLTQEDGAHIRCMSFFFVFFFKSVRLSTCDVTVSIYLFYLFLDNHQHVEHELRWSSVAQTGRTTSLARLLVQSRTQFLQYSETTALLNRWHNHVFPLIQKGEFVDLVCLSFCQSDDSLAKISTFVCIKCVSEGQRAV